MNTKDKDEQRALDLLKNWDGYMEEDSPGAAFI